MDYKKIKTTHEAITRNFSDFDKETENFYKTVVILSKRANQINTKIKEELHERLKEYVSQIDNLEEIFENRDQIEAAKVYEAIPKPTLLAIHEFLNDQLYFEEKEKEQV